MSNKSTGYQQKLEEYLESLSDGETPDAAHMAELAEEFSEKSEPFDIDALVKSIVKNIPAQSGGLDTAELVRLIKGDDKGEKIQSYGLTQNQMKKIKEFQMTGKVPMINGNKVSRYKFPAHEKDLIHFTTEKVTYKPDTDIKTSRPRYHIKSVTDFERMAKSVKGKDEKVNPENAFQGLKLTILHDPRTNVPSPEKAIDKTEDEQMEEMNEGAIRQLYVATFNEEALPSDSKKIMIELIKEKRQADASN